MKRKKNNPANEKSTSFLNQILGVFVHTPNEQLNYKQIAFALGIREKTGQKQVMEGLERLRRQNSLIETQKGKFKLNPNKLEELGIRKYITGKVDMKATGKAYVISAELGEDVFIGSSNTGQALHGDIVKVLLFPKRKDRKLEGQIVEVIKRAKNQFVGIIQKSKNYAFLVADSQNMPVDIFIPIDSLKDAKDGQKAVVEITEWPRQTKNPFGKVTKVLGWPGENNVEMQAILADYGFPLGFPKQVEQEADKIPETIPADEIKLRRDFRKIPTFTIDPGDAKDFDDAISFRKLENGNSEVGVHIADVSHYVKPGSAIDEEAYNRATSVYLVDRTFPMLPEKLSNHLCSLKPNEDKLCFAVVFEMDDQAKIVNHWIGKTVICSQRRFDYDEAQKIIEEGVGDMAFEVTEVHKLAQIIRSKRFKNGAINFETREVKFRLDEDGKPIGVYVKEYKDSNKLIEEFMLLANKRVAESIGVKRGIHPPKTFVYRIHDEPTPEKLNNFVQLVKKLGYQMKTTDRKHLAGSFNHIFEQIKGKGEENLVETVAIRTMAKAIYSTQNIGHYGLAFNYYTHFTSPIRRYPDLMVHRLLWSYLNKGTSADAAEYESYCEHCSEMERKAEQSERDSVKYKQAEYLMNHIGDVFDGLISGVSKWGIYVEIAESKCEGMVRLGDMKDDFYYLDEENYQVIGQKYGTVYKLGYPAKVRVKNVDLAKKQIDFVMAEE